MQKLTVYGILKLLSYQLFSTACGYKRQLRVDFRCEQMGVRQSIGVYK